MSAPIRTASSTSPRLASSLTLLFLLVAACAQPRTAGYEGPLPTSQARTDGLTPLRGMVFVDETRAFGGGELVVAGFVVGGEPVVWLDQLDDAGGLVKRNFLPVLTDGDVADLHQRVTGESLERFEGPLSDRYRETLGL